MSRALVWESVSWRNGEDQYRFDIERGGLFATLSAPGNRRLTLPMVVWEGLLDALKASKSTHARGEQNQQYPARSRSRWYDGEIGEVADAYKSGRSISEIAHAHNRSAYAIEHQLDKLGLISKAAMYGAMGQPGTPVVPRQGGPAALTVDAHSREIDAPPAEAGRWPPLSCHDDSAAKA